MLCEAQNIIRQTLPPTERILVGLSGGADSVALTHILHMMGYKLVLVHVNFHLRGEESDRDELFVRRLHQEKYPDAQLLVFSTNTYEIATSKSISIEMAAREIRYSYFEEVAQETGCKWIAVGHHADDQIETVLLNISRQTGIKGLAGMKVRNQKIFRPFLTTWKNEILEYIEANGLKYVTDSTNLEDFARRNYIRHHVISLLEVLNPSFKRGLLASIKVLREEADALDHLVANFELEYYNSMEHSISLENIVDDANNRLFFKRFITGKGFSFSQAESMIRAWDSEKTTTYIGSTVAAQCFRHKLFILPNHMEKYSIPVIGCCKIPNIGSLRLESSAIDGYQLAMSTRCANSSMILRSANKEDVFQPFGMKRGSKSVFRYLGEKGIPEYYRSFCPVLENEGTILAVVPFGISESAKYSSKVDSVGILFRPYGTPLGALLNAHSSKEREK